MNREIAAHAADPIDAAGCFALGMNYSAGAGVAVAAPPLSFGSLDVVEAATHYPAPQHAPGRTLPFRVTHDDHRHPPRHRDRR